MVLLLLYQVLKVQKPVMFLLFQLVGQTIVLVLVVVAAIWIYMSEMVVHQHKQLMIVDLMPVVIMKVVLVPVPALTIL